MGPSREWKRLLQASIKRQRNHRTAKFVQLVRIWHDPAHCRHGSGGWQR